MSRFMEHIKRLSSSQRGFTLTESLAAIIILMLLTACMVTGIQLASSSLTKMVTQSEGKALCSTLEQSITNELRFSASVHPASDSESTAVTYYSSPTAGNQCMLCLVDSDGSYVDFIGNDAVKGQLAVTPVDKETGAVELADGEKPTVLLAKASYTNSTTCNMSLVYHKSGNYFTVTLTVYDRNGAVITTDTFDVSRINS